MAATLVQSSVQVEPSNQNGVTLTLSSAPTSGNLLVLCHGFYYQPGGGGIQSASSGFTHRILAGTTGFLVCMNILDKVATGSEGTSIVVTQGGQSRPNCGWIGEYSGMTASPFITGSTDAASNSSSNVTSKVSGNSNTGTVDDALLVAAWGQTTNEGPYSGEAFTNSFSLLTANGGVNGTSDHRIVVASRSVSSASTYSTTYSWTPATETNGCIAAYQISVTSVLQIAVQEDLTVADVVTILLPTLFIARSEGLTVAEVTLASSGSGNNTKTMLISGTQADINATLAFGIDYTSDSGYTGPDILTMLSTNATNNTDTDTVQITVVAAAGTPQIEEETLADAPPHRRHVN